MNPSRPLHPMWLAASMPGLILGLLIAAGCGTGGGSSGGSSSSKDDAPPAADFAGADGWVNTDKPVALADLRGQVVVLDFWTYSSVHCAHVLPDLNALTTKYADQPVVILGVHSGKFDEEKDPDAVRQAVRREDFIFPVAIDSGHRIWDAYKVKSWPTLVVVGPEGRVERTYAGEGHGDELNQAVATLLESGRKNKTLANHLTLTAPSQPIPSGVLEFPGKVLADAATGRLFISDTHHNRILLADLSGQVKKVIGSGHVGLQDGELASAQFHHPQGLALSEDGQTLYAADTGNHAVRAVDLKAGSVTTLAGTGRHAHVFHPDGPGRATDLSSPWDVSRVGDTLYVAMAGTHQIWSCDLPDGRVHDLAGTGTEGDHDGLAGKAEFAQPSGLATDGARSGGFLYVADAEDSSIRAVSVADETPVKARVKTIAGSGDLFGFGLVNRSGQQARFQHPTGIALAAAPPGGPNLLYVGDTYNGVVRTIDLTTFAVATLAGTGRHEPGSPSGGLTDIGLYEPGGLSLAGDMLFVADTNHHRVVALDLKAKKARVVEVRVGS